jgi:hypothetical protein
VALKQVADEMLEISWVGGVLGVKILRTAMERHGRWCYVITNAFKHSTARPNCLNSKFLKTVPIIKPIYSQCLSYYMQTDRQTGREPDGKKNMANWNGEFLKGSCKSGTKIVTNQNRRIPFGGEC